MLCAFSSDYRELYKADIYRTLALPNDHIVHFRYKKKYVDDNILSSPDEIIGKDIVIFHSPNNDGTSEGTTLNNISVRKAKITKSYVSEDTNVFHIYMQLKDFCNVTIDTNNPPEKQPKQKFLSDLSCTEKPEEKNWQSRVEKIAPHFSDLTYMYIKGLYEKTLWGEKLISPSVNDCKTFSSYKIKHGTKYSVNISIGNPQEKGQGIEIDKNKDILTLNCINPLTSSAQFDDFWIPLSIKSLAANNQTSLVKFKPLEATGNNKYNEYETTLEFDLKLSLHKAAHFGLLATMAAAALIIIQPHDPNDIKPETWEIIFATLLFWFSSGALFYWFNKK